VNVIGIGHILFPDKVSLLFAPGPATPDSRVLRHLAGISPALACSHRERSSAPLERVGARFNRLWQEPNLITGMGTQPLLGSVTANGGRAANLGRRRVAHAVKPIQCNSGAALCESRACSRVRYSVCHASRGQSYPAVAEISQHVMGPLPDSLKLARELRKRQVGSFAANVVFSATGDRGRLFARSQSTEHQSLSLRRTYLDVYQ
jgi:hypothetical protein